MQAYEKGDPAYFATPPVNLVYALHASLTRITKEKPTLEERFRLHREASYRVRHALVELDLRHVAIGRENAANGMTAVRVNDSLIKRN